MSTPVQEIEKLKKQVGRLGAMDIPSSFYKEARVRSIVGADSLLVTDHILRASGTFTVTLVAATGSNNVYTIKNSGAGVITLDGAGAETIEGAPTLALVAGNSATILDATAGNWEII